MGTYYSGEVEEDFGTVRIQVETRKDRTNARVSMQPHGFWSRDVVRVSQSTGEYFSRDADISNSSGGHEDYGTAPRARNLAAALTHAAELVDAWERDGLEVWVAALADIEGIEVEDFPE